MHIDGFAGVERHNRPTSERAALCGCFDGNKFPSKEKRCPQAQQSAAISMIGRARRAFVEGGGCV